MCGHTIRKWFRKQENVFIELLGVLIWVAITGGALYYYFMGVLDLLTLVQIVGGLILAGLPIYLYLVKKREQILLLGFTSKYFVEQDDAKIDDLLGLLIAGKWEKLKIDPIEEFFNTLKNLCYRGDCEIRRRMAEALPALYKLDLFESEELAEILRYDWDEEKWKGDNRRRMVESLPYIMKKDKKFAKKSLEVIDRDEIYTVIAIIEVIDAWSGQISKKQGEKLFDSTVTQMRKIGFGEEEIEIVVQLWGLLKLTHSDKKAAAVRFEELKNTPNVCLQICLARNLRRLCRGFPKCCEKPMCNGTPEKILELMAFFLQEDKHRHVRRPIAKEQTLECLLVLLRYRSYREKAKQIIWTLITDNDDIIRLSAFDKIDNVLEIDANFGLDILQYVIENNHNSKLVERAKHLKQRLTEQLK